MEETNFPFKHTNGTIRKIWIVKFEEERSVLYVGQIMSKAIKKIVEEARDNAYTELDLADREIKSLNSVPILRKL